MQFVDSEEFSVAFAWGLVLLGVGGPLFAECHRHLENGHVVFGCAFGVAGSVLGALCLWRIAAGLGTVRDGPHRDR